MLNLSRPSARQLCTAGVGNIFVENHIEDNIAICRTDYPGSESETIPLDTEPHGRYPLTCPDATQYYQYMGAATSAQYYVNPAGTPIEVACRWGKLGDTGNWAPVNLGVGRGATGMTYISIIPNNPTNPDGALNFSIDIIGNNLSGQCFYREGRIYSNDMDSPTGCTVSRVSEIILPFS